MAKPGLSAREKGEEDSPWNPRRRRLHLAAAYGGSARRRPLQLRLRRIWSLAAPCLGESASPSPASSLPRRVGVALRVPWEMRGRERETWEMRRGEAARARRRLGVVLGSSQWAEMGWADFLLLLFFFLFRFPANVCIATVCIAMHRCFLVAFFRWYGVALDA